VDPLAALPKGQVPYLASVQLLDALPYSPDELYDGYLLLRSERPAAAVAPAPVEARGVDDGGVSRWRNLGYGLQWWFFAGAAVWFWWTVLRRSLREQRAAEPTQVAA
jgi:cytochrome oxidase assembly protein ShyY1